MSMNEWHCVLGTLPEYWYITDIDNFHSPGMVKQLSSITVGVWCGDKWNHICILLSPNFLITSPPVQFHFSSGIVVSNSQSVFLDINRLIFPSKLVKSLYFWVMRRSQVRGLLAKVNIAVCFHPLVWTFSNKSNAQEFCTKISAAQKVELTLCSCQALVYCQFFINCHAYRLFSVHWCIPVLSSELIMS